MQRSPAQQARFRPQQPRWRLHHELRQRVRAGRLALCGGDGECAAGQTIYRRAARADFKLLFSGFYFLSVGAKGHHFVGARQDEMEGKAYDD